MAEETSFTPILEVSKHTSDIIASLIILLISGAGFVGGYFQNDYSVEASELFDQATDMREEANEVLNKVGIAFEIEDEANFMENRGNKFSLGLSIITVAIVLSTTMSNRLNEKKVYDRINLVRSDLLRDPELGRSKGDKFAIPVIIFALIISALGLLWGYIDFP